MKYQSTLAFKADYKRLSASEKSLFKDSVRRLNAAYDLHRKQRGVGLPPWPKNLRVKSLTDAPGIFEMTWSFSGPDGRATFEFFDIGDQVGIRWRRIGDHRILRVRNH